MAKNTSEPVAVEYMQRHYPSIRWEEMGRVELSREFFARLPRNLDSGRYAVAVVGIKEWMRSSAIGDGITSASAALLTRCDSKREVEEIAAVANDLQPGLMPGQGVAWVYAALPYDITDYLSQQALRNGRRKCDRRIAS